jgi:hydrogenase maturation protease
LHFLLDTLPEIENRALMSDSVDGAGNGFPSAIKVIGIGQSLRGDDSAGLLAVRLWVKKFHSNGLPPGVQVELAELPGVGLLDLLEGARFAILVDAVHSGVASGTIHQLTADQLETYGGSASAHGWGVAETLSLGKQLSPANLPSELVIIGIEAGQLELGEGLSPEVASSLPEVARLIEEYLNIALH